jgi:hypothetical protein
MFGSAVHYTFLPRCLSRSLISVIDFAILQAALAGAVSWSTQRFRQTPQQTGVAPNTPASAENRSNILIAGVAFAVAIVMMNASVAYGSVSGSRMIKSLEPAIVSGIQLLSGTTMNHRADLPWVCLLAVAVSTMLAVAPTGITMFSAAAAFVSTAGISTRNVFMKNHMLQSPNACAASSPPGSGGMHCPPPPSLDVGMVSAMVSDAQTFLNIVACGILIPIASCCFMFPGSRQLPGLVQASDVAIASVSFAAFQVAALMVLERVSPTRQAAIKSLQNTLTTAWAMLIDSKGKKHNSLEIVPALVWGVCVTALATDVQMTMFTSSTDWGCLTTSEHCVRACRKGDNHAETAGGTDCLRDGIDGQISLKLDAEDGGVRIGALAFTGQISERKWQVVYVACVLAIVLQGIAIVSGRVDF